MSDTIVDFGGFTVDVSKIRGFEKPIPNTAGLYDLTPITFNDQFECLYLGVAVDQVRSAYEKYVSSRKPKPDGWYWDKGTGGRRKLIRITDGTIDATWGEPSFRPKVSQSQWSGYEPADPLSGEFMHAMRNNGFHPADWL